MSLYIKILSIVNCTAALHGLILSFILRVKKKNCEANHILALLVFFFSINMAGPIYFTYRFYRQLPFLVPFFSAVPLTFGPLLYLYIKALTRRHFCYSKTDLLHGLPAVLVFLGYVFLYVVSFPGIDNALERIYFQQSVLSYLSIVLSLGQVFVYIILCLRMLRVHTRQIKESFSVIEKINLSWIRHLIIMFILVWIIAAALQSLLPGDLLKEKLDDAITYFLISLIIFTIGYRGLSQPEIFAGIPGDTAAEKGKKYARTGLSQERSVELRQRLFQLMTEKKLYLDQELTLDQVAEIMEVPSHQLSQVINESIEQNFYRFINNYRVEEAKKRLVQGATRGDKLIKIAFDSGFNSLSTFNRVFKDLTGESPSQFRKSPDQGFGC